MKYRRDWDLRSIPFEAIPEDLLKTWISLRTNSIKGKKAVDPKRREFLDRKAEAMRKHRAAEKKRLEAGK